jgi:hypothetical protein
VAKSVLASAIRVQYSETMFDTIKPQIATAAEKLAHLRRFL